MLEVVAWRPAAREAVELSGFDPRSQWYRNVLAGQAVEAQIGRLRFAPAARPLGTDEAVGVLADDPVLFATTQATWAPIDLRFELLTGEVDPDRIARVFVVPYIGMACVVVGFEHGDWGPAGGAGRSAQLHDRTERPGAVEVMSPDQAVSFLAGKDGHGKPTSTGSQLSGARQTSLDRHSR